MANSDDYSDNPPAGDIADTGTFQRFVEHESTMDAAESSGNGKWIAIAAIIAIIVIAIVVWLLTR